MIALNVFLNKMVVGMGLTGNPASTASPEIPAETVHRESMEQMEQQDKEDRPGLPEYRVRIFGSIHEK